MVVNPRTGKKKKVKKQVPDYIPDHDAVILAKMRKRSYNLDMSLFDFAGIRFGWSSVIGIIPGFGDAADAGMALLLVWRCSKIECGLGSTALVTMLINVLLDFIVGIVPFIGDLADAAFKANTRNVRVLEKRLDEVYKPNGLRTKDAEAQKKVKEDYRKSGMTYEPEYEAPPATVIEDFSDDELEDRRRFLNDGRAPEGQHAQIGAAPAANAVTQPNDAAARTGQSARGGWLSAFRSAKQPAPDVERGTIASSGQVRNVPNS